MQSLDRDTSENVEVLKLSGNFDFKFFRQFRELYEPVLRNSDICTIEIDLHGVDYIDSSALGMLLQLREKAADKKIVLSRCSAVVLEVAQFNRLFELH
jgi:HptB-dependent secretion and biofilm anti anti-sigma factor